jgi:hypothetical protein
LPLNQVHTMLKTNVSHYLEGLAASRKGTAKKRG